VGSLAIPLVASYQATPPSGLNLPRKGLRHPNHAAAGRREGARFLPCLDYCAPEETPRVKPLDEATGWQSLSENPVYHARSGPSRGSGRYCQLSVNPNSLGTEYLPERQRGNLSSRVIVSSTLTIGNSSGSALRLLCMDWREHEALLAPPLPLEAEQAPPSIRSLLPERLVKDPARVGYNEVNLL
jgi:hypothetical protein